MAEEHKIIASMLRRNFLSLAATALAAKPKPDLNVLMIAVDDLRPELGCYGRTNIHSPNIDKLASRGMIFERAYCQQAVCSPSRTSLLTGLRPDTTRIYELQTHFRKTVPNAVTLPERFKQAGYQTTGLSKIFHGVLDDAQSWTIPHWRPGAPAEWGSEENAAASAAWNKTLRENDWYMKSPAPMGRGPVWNSPDVADDALPDGKTSRTAISALQKLKNDKFFLAVGFHKPHLPLVAPKRYFDLYPKEKIDFIDYPDKPRGAPPFAFHPNGELRQYEGVPRPGEPIPAALGLELIRAYYACISYTDAQIGLVLNELDRLNLREKTMVVLWGDHGWHLNNHGLWHKHTNFEKATRAPLVVSVPGQRNRGGSSKALVEFVDIYPTICDAAGLSTPSSLEGKSMMPLLDNPRKAWKRAAFSQYPRVHEGRRMMGYSMRTDRYRYTEWQALDNRDVLAVELYDYVKDPSESANVAGDVEYRGAVSQLSKQLAAGWRASA